MYPIIEILIAQNVNNYRYRWQSYISNMPYSPHLKYPHILAVTFKETYSFFDNYSNIGALIPTLFSNSDFFISLSINILNSLLYETFMIFLHSFLEFTIYYHILLYLLSIFLICLMFFVIISI